MNLLKSASKTAIGAALAVTLATTMAAPAGASTPTPTPTGQLVVLVTPKTGTTTLPDNQSQAVPAVVVAAAGWCAAGVLGSVPTTALTDILNGKASGWKTYVRNAAVSCLIGNFGGWAYRVLPSWAKERAINAVISFVIYVARAR